MILYTDNSTEYMIAYPGTNITDVISASEMTYEISIFDPRLPNVCQPSSLLQSPPLFAISTINLQYQEIRNPLGLTSIGSLGSSSCSGSTTVTRTPFYIYSGSFTTSINTGLGNCDIANTHLPFPSASCRGTALFLGMASGIVNTYTSVRAISKLDIWLNLSALVGGVQFFFWFFTVFTS